jgi:DHA1 family inner membrane transport protein
LVWLGFAAASLVGIPGATAIGHALGWRATFWAISGVGAVAAFAIALCIPRQDAGERSHIASEVRALARTQVVLAMAISLVVCAATFSVFTYLAPFVVTETGLRAEALPAMLLFFGVGGTLGLLVAGRIRNRDALLAVIAMLLALALVFLLLMLASRSPVLVAVAIAAWGFLFLAPCVPLQTRVVMEAREGPNLASTLNQSAFNVGNALGPAIGAGALWAGLPYAQLPLIGAVIAVLGAALGLLALRLDRAGIA